MEVHTLYHYESFNPENSVRTLSQGVIYCSTPSRFNDPWDCKPTFDTSGLDDPKRYEDHVQWFDAIGRKHFPALDEAERQRRIRIMRSDRPFLEQMIRGCSSDIARAIDSRYRVYCLSSDPTSTLMWSHYSQHHQGICLEFDARNDVFGSALKVDYRETYPGLALDCGDDSQAILTLLAKSTVWEYEDEYRIIAEERAQAIAKDTLKTDDNFLVYPPGSLKAVIVGCQADDATVREVRQIIEKNGRGIAIKRAVRTPNHYSLTIAA
jgi:hypothetical protein